MNILVIMNKETPFTRISDHRISSKRRTTTPFALKDRHDPKEVFWRTPKSLSSIIELLYLSFPWTRFFLTDEEENFFKKSRFFDFPRFYRLDKHFSGQTLVVASQFGVVESIANIFEVSRCKL